MSYSILSSSEFRTGRYSVVAYRAQDKMAIMTWRNEQMAVLRQKRKLTEDDQNRYFTQYIEKSFHEMTPSIMLFSFLSDEVCIGYGGLTNLDWENKRCELSFLLSSERVKNPEQYELDFRAFITLMKKIVFEEIHFNRLYTETYDLRPLHISILEKEDFVLEGRLREHVYIDGQFVDSLMHGILKSQNSATR